MTEKQQQYVKILKIMYTCKYIGGGISPTTCQGGRISCGTTTTISVETTLIFV